RMSNAVPTRLRLGRRRGTVVSMSSVRRQRKIPGDGPLPAALPYVAAAATIAASATALDFGLLLRVGLPLIFLAFGLQRALDASVRRARLRMRADAWLANATSANPAV